MKYWQHLDIGDHELYAQQILKALTFDFSRRPFWTALNLHNLRKSVPEMFEALLKFDLVPKEAALITLNRDISTIHTDHTDGKNAGVIARLNIPLLNTVGSTTAFYDLHHVPPKRVRVQDDPIYAAVGAKIWSDGGADRHRFTPVTTVCLDRPTILRVSEAHTVFCDSCAFPRVSLTMSFLRDASELFTE